MGLINYHNHTYHCSHAAGTIEEYIEKAIKCNIDEIGFADHAPLPAGLREGISMHPDETEIYINEIIDLKKKYADRISIKLGFEVDYPLHDTFNKKYFNDSRIDFLIGSCHFINSWPFDHPDHIDGFKNKNIDEIYTNYYKLIESLVESKLFDIVGHFDLVKKFGHRATKNFKPTIEKISSKLAAYNIVVEINTSGLLKPVSEIYPSFEIIKIFYEKNVPVTISSDAHSHELVDYMLETTIKKLKKIGYRKISGFNKRQRYEISIA